MDNALDGTMLSECTKCKKYASDVEMDLFKSGAGLCDVCRTEACFDSMMDDARSDSSNTLPRSSSGVSILNEDDTTIFPVTTTTISIPKATPSGSMDDDITLTHVQSFCIKHGFTNDIASTADGLLDKLTQAEMKYNRDPIVFAASAVYVACRLQVVPRTYKEMYTLAGISRDKLLSAIKVIEAHVNATAFPRVTPAGLVVRYCIVLNLHTTVKTICLDVANRVTYYGLSGGKNPTSTAAAIIFFTCKLFGIPLTVHELAAVAEVQYPTVRSNFEMLRGEYMKLVNPKWLENEVGNVQQLFSSN